MRFEWPFSKKEKGAEDAGDFEIIDSEKETKGAVRRQEITEAIDRIQRAIEFMGSQDRRFPLPGTTEQKEAARKRAEDLKGQLEAALSVGKVSREVWKKKEKFLKER